MASKWNITALVKKCTEVHIIEIIEMSVSTTSKKKFYILIS